MEWVEDTTPLAVEREPGLGFAVNEDRKAAEAIGELRRRNAKLC